MATIGSQQTGLTTEEVLRRLASAGNVKAKEQLAAMGGGDTPKVSTPITSTPKTIGDQETGITKEQVIDRLASAGNKEAIAAKANNYTVPTKSLTPAPEKTLPEAKKSSLVDFADALNQATSLARARRQEGEMGILDQYGFKPGQVQAGTMGSILSLLETRGNNTEETMRNAAMDAYKTEEINKKAEKANIQELALQLMTKGVDQTTIQGMLNMDSFDEAIKSAAGALKSTKEYTDIREVDGKLIGIKTDGTYETIYEGSGGGGGGYAPTSDMKEYEFAKKEGFEGSFQDWLGSGKTGSEPDFDTAKKFIEANTLASDEELKAGLLERRGDLNLTVTDINALIASTDRVTEQDVKEAASEVLVDVWDGDWWRSKDTNNIGVINSELAEAKAAAKKAIYKKPYNIKQGSSMEKRILEAIDAMTYSDVKNLL